MPKSTTPPDKQVLMPRTAPPLKPGRRVTDPRGRDADKFPALEAQLRALERDIRAARAGLRRASAGGLELRADRRRPEPPRRYGERVRLPDGAEILVRPVEPADAEALREGFDHLGAVSRYRRFLTPIDHLTPDQLAFLTHVDHARHEALAALDARTGAGVGVARFVRDDADPAQAEFAVVITDAWQGRGVGTVLLDRLAALARARGIERFTARMLVGNEPARRLLAHVAETVSQRVDGGTVLITARLRPEAGV